MNLVRKGAGWYGSPTAKWKPLIKQTAPKTDRAGNGHCKANDFPSLEASAHTARASLRRLEHDRILDPLATPEAFLMTVCFPLPTRYRTAGMRKSFVSQHTALHDPKRWSVTSCDLTSIRPQTRRTCLRPTHPWAVAREVQVGSRWVLTVTHFQWPRRAEKWPKRPYQCRDRGKQTHPVRSRASNLDVDSLRALNCTVLFRGFVVIGFFLFCIPPQDSKRMVESAFTCEWLTARDSTTGTGDSDGGRQNIGHHLFPRYLGYWRDWPLRPVWFFGGCNRLDRRPSWPTRWPIERQSVWKDKAILAPRLESKVHFIRTSLTVMKAVHMIVKPLKGVFLCVFQGNCNRFNGRPCWFCFEISSNTFCLAWCDLFIFS